MREDVVLKLRKDVLKLATRHDCQSDEFVLALADALATVAVTLDQHAGKKSITDRLHSFCGRVEKTYERMNTLHALKAGITGEAQ